MTKKIVKGFEFYGIVLDVYFPFDEDLEDDGKFKNPPIKRMVHPCLILHVVEYADSVSFIIAPGTSQKTRQEGFGNFEVSSIIVEDESLQLTKKTKFKISSRNIKILNQNKETNFFKKFSSGEIAKRGVLKDIDRDKIYKHLNLTGMLMLANELAIIKSGSIPIDKRGTYIYEKK